MDNAVILRPVRTADDASAIETLYAACITTESGIGPVTATRWLNAVALPQFGGGRDFLCATEASTLVALAESSLRDEGDRQTRLVKLLVRPDRRRRGIGTALLDAVLDQGPDEAALALHCLVRSSWTAALGFLNRYGFAEVERELFMKCDALVAAAKSPPGVVIGSPEQPGAMVEEAAAIHNEAFRGSAGFMIKTAQDMRKDMHGLRLWTAACMTTGKVVAFALIESEEEASWLETVAVRPEYQGRGIGAALVTAAFHGDGADPGRPAELGVSSCNPAALRLYQRIGFTVKSEKLRYAASRQGLVAQMVSP